MIIGRTLIGLGVLLIVTGLVALLWARWGPQTRLPGDLVFRHGPVTVFLPIASCILLSLLMTLLINLFLRHR